MAETWVCEWRREKATGKYLGCDGRVHGVAYPFCPYCSRPTRIVEGDKAMADPPARVWLTEDAADLYGRGRLSESEIEYRHVSKCVWHNIGADGDYMVYHRDCGGHELRIEWPGMASMRHWNYCNFCGGEIEVKE